MTNIVIDVSNEFPALADNLTTLQERLNSDLTPLMEAIGRVLEMGILQRFADKKSPTGVTWESLAPATIKRKKNKQVTKDGVTAVGLMVESGDLFQSVQSQVTNGKVEVGVTKDYGIWHQIGLADRNLPARPFIGISDDDREEVNNVIHDFLEGIIHE